MSRDIFCKHRLTQPFGRRFAPPCSGTSVGLYGTSFTSNSASAGGDDTYRASFSLITIHATCPYPYHKVSPTQGTALSTKDCFNCIDSDVEGPSYSFSGCAAPCQATSTTTDDGSDGNFYCINGGATGGFAPVCFCYCQDGYRGTNCEIADPCQATSTPTDDGSDGNFYCINGGEIGGTTGSCTCTSCDSDYLGNHCEATSAPTYAPTQSPTSAPTPSPTQAPTQAPTTPPTSAPTTAPCSSDPCGDNAVCVDIDDGEHDFFCDCENGFSGGGKFVRGEIGECAGETSSEETRTSANLQPSPKKSPLSYHGRNLGLRRH